MNPYFVVVIENIAGITFSLIAIVLVAVLLLWICRAGIPWLEERRRDCLVEKYVFAAEKQFASGRLKGSKKAWVRDMLKEHKIELTQEVDASIEAAALRLDHDSVHAVYHINGYQHDHPPSKNE